jgi:exodeoxyribonuclease-5
MLTDQFAKDIEHYLGETPTRGQNALIEQLARFLLEPKRREVLVLKGYAGTGKTSIIGAFVKSLEKHKQKFVLLAPTGRAAKVISGYSGNEAFTIHKKIYRQKSLKDGVGLFSLDFNPHQSTIFIVDEASMISDQLSDGSSFGSGRLLSDLISYVYNDKDCRMILVGDSAQLPPVKTLLSPALDAKELAAYNLQVTCCELNEVVRQTSNSGILHNATNVRSLIGEDGHFPSLTTEGYKDFIRITGAELIESITEAYEKSSIEDTMVVCRSNKRAIQYNMGIRSQILWYEEAISRDDYLMIVRNNYFWLPGEGKEGFIANGDIVKVERIKKYKEQYGFHFALVELSFVDYPDMEIEAWIMLDTLSSETPAMSYDDNKKLYFAVMEDYAHITTQKKRLEAIKSDPFFNALQVKYAYAVTCHKAQGGQWKNVFVDQGYLTDEMMNTEFLRWLYTSFTRATEKLYLVNFKDEFFK